MVCVVCSCCATSPYSEVCRTKGDIGSEETLCHDIYPARPITLRYVTLPVMADIVISEPLCFYAIISEKWLNQC